MTTARARALYAALALAIIVVGLGVHWGGAALNPTLRDVLGDSLWAAMLFCWVSAVVPGNTLRVRAGAALTLCIAVELSQLYHTSALDALRETRAGQLVLGSGFDPRDLVAYAVGVLFAAFVDQAVMPQTPTN